MKLLMVSGWAAAPDILAPLARALHGGAQTQLVGFHELLPPGEAAEDETNLPSCVAQRLVARLAETDTPPFLLGWSSGGLAALAAAAAAPTRVRGLILLSATARFCRTEGYPPGARPAELRALRQGLAGDMDEVLRGFFRASALPAASEATPGQLEAARALGRDSLLAGLDFLAATDLRPVLEAFPLPCLLLHGREDRIIPVQAANYLAQHLPRARLVLLDGIGHDLPHRAPDAAANEIASFLKEHA